MGPSNAGFALAPGILPHTHLLDNLYAPGWYVSDSARRQATVTLTRDASMHADVHRAEILVGFEITFIFLSFSVRFQFVSGTRRPPALDRGAQVPRYLQILADFSGCFADGL